MNCPVWGGEDGAVGVDGEVFPIGLELDWFEPLRTSGAAATHGASAEVASMQPARPDKDRDLDLSTMFNIYTHCIHY